MNTSFMDETNILKIELFSSKDLSKNAKIVKIKVIEGRALLITDSRDFSSDDVNTIKLDDLIGLEVSQINDKVSKLKIFSSTPIEIESKIHNTKKIERKKNIIELYANNLSIQQEFRDYVLGSLWEHNKKEFNSGIDANDLTYSKPEGLKAYEKKVLAVICPKSGNGSAESLFKQAEDALKSNGFIIDTLKTTHKNHAKEYIQELEKETLKQYYSILCFSGDGIVHELLNGFYGRPDFEELDLRIAPFLGGEVNTMMLNSLSDWNFTKSLLNMVYVSTRARFRSTTVTKYVTSNLDTHVIYSIIGLNFGFYADLDLFRQQKSWYGKVFADVYSVFKLMFFAYKRQAKIWTSEQTIGIQSDMKLDTIDLIEDSSCVEGWDLCSEKIYNFLYFTSPEWTENENISESRELGCGFGEAVVNTEKEGYMSFVKTLMHIGDRNLDKNLPDKVKKVKSFRIELEDDSAQKSFYYIDGEFYEAKTVQGTILNNNNQVKIMA